MARIFISYRRSDSEGFVGRLYDHLKRVFTDSQLYLDVQSIRLGRNFAYEIEEAITDADVVMVVIGNQWLSVQNEQGQRRLDDSEDYVRLEVAAALRQHKLVIPILIQKAKLPAVESLPHDIRELGRLQAAVLSHDNFEHDVDRLLLAVKNRLGVAFLSDVEFGSHLAIFFDLAGYSVCTDSTADPNSGELLIEETRLGSTRRILVLPQVVKTPLTSADVTTLHTQHALRCRAGDIDEIAVVSLGGLDRDAELLVKSIRELSHVKYSVLQDTVMDFRSYVAALVSQYDDDGLSSYYIPAKSNSADGNPETNLEETIMAWISNAETRPIAILGGYGSGKTTFARRLAYVLAKDHLQDTTRRVPILLRLGDISAEQSLEGLLGKHFTTRTFVRNYNFDIFMSLNQSGRFVIILDGFDEMKHTLSWEEFRYNFSQLNRLTVGGSKVILLGRPTAFLSDDEHNYALHGMAKNIRGQTLRDPNWPNYIEHYITSFDEKDIKDFLSRYLRFRSESTGARQERSLMKLMVKAMSSNHLIDLAGRPVHLKMLVEVLPQWTGELDHLTMSALYSYFIDLTIQREQGKLTRRRFDTRERRAFASAVAWWLWTSRKESSFLAESIPDEIIQEFSKAGEQLDSVKRDLISACFLERKLGGALYFPHRSFQEFLVGEYIVDQLICGSLGLDDTLKWMTSEVMTFMDGMVGSKELRSLSAVVAKYKGTLPLEFLMVWGSNQEARDSLFRDVQWRFDSTSASYIVTEPNFLNSPWCALLCTLLVNKYEQYKHLIRPLIESLLQDIDRLSQQAPRTPKKRTVGNANYIPVNEMDHIDDKIVLSCLIDLLCICSLAEVAGKGSAAKTEHNLAAVALAKVSKIGLVTEVHDRHNKKSVVVVPDFRIADVLCRVQVAMKSQTLTVKGIYYALGRHLLAFCWLLGWGNRDKITYQDLALVSSLLQVPKGELDAIHAFQTAFEFVPVSAQ